MVWEQVDTHPHLKIYLKVDGEKRAQMPLKGDHHWPTSEMSCWWADDGPTLNAAMVALRFFWASSPVLQRNPIDL